jgi:hypothetical protein
MIKEVLADNHFEALSSQLLKLKKKEIDRLEDYLDDSKFWESIVSLRYAQLAAYCSDIWMQGVSKERKKDVERILKRYSDSF